MVLYGAFVASIRNVPAGKRISACASEKGKREGQTHREARVQSP
jgi:hypothetical protein